jgi:uncharacterized protein YprB with RNaseH-like and TPR domain
VDFDDGSHYSKDDRAKHLPICILKVVEQADGCRRAEPEFEVGEALFGFIQFRR